MSSAGTRLSSIAGKSFRVLALLLLLLLGWIAIGALHLFITWHNAPVTPLASGLVSTRLWNMGFVSAEGTWTIDGDKHAFPINMSKILCYKDRYCYSSEAHLSDNYLVAELELYEITKWDETTLEFIKDADCVSYVYVINRSTEKLTGRRVAKKGTDNPSCDIASPDLKLSFVRGTAVVNQLQSENAPKIQSTVLATIWGLFILIWIWRVIRRAPVKAHVWE
jgi:hypothetical protein